MQSLSKDVVLMLFSSVDNIEDSNELAKQLWDAKEGGKDFHSTRFNHCSIEGIEYKMSSPFYPQPLMLHNLNKE